MPATDGERTDQEIRKHAAATRRMNVFFYAAVTMIWGSTWLAISYQVGPVDAAASVFYRSAAAAVLLLAFLWLRRKPMRFSLRQHLMMVIMGGTLFSGNYLFLYPAEKLLPSGLVAVLFAMTLPFNLLNAGLLLGQGVGRRVLIATATGIVGIVLVFWSDLAHFDLTGPSLRGVGLALAAAYLFSLGGVVAGRSRSSGVPVLQAEAYGLVYGSLLLLPVTLLTGGFRVDLRPSYLLSLGYLVIFGSVIGFAMYLTVTVRLGAARAAYVTVLFPIVALLWSTWLDDYRWSPLNLGGVVLILLGSGLAVAGPSTPDGPAPEDPAPENPPPETPSDRVPEDRLAVR